MILAIQVPTPAEIVQIALMLGLGILAYYVTNRWARKHGKGSHRQAEMKKKGGMSTSSRQRRGGRKRR